MTWPVVACVTTVLGAVIWFHLLSTELLAETTGGTTSQTAVDGPEWQEAGAAGRDPP